MEPMVQPPSHTLKEAFQKLKGCPPSQQYIEEAAKKVLLLPDEVRMWFDHPQSVSDNCKRGAAQAAETRRKRKVEKEKRQVPLVNCGVCHEQYKGITEEIERWLGCESCSSWFHYVCVGIDVEPEFYFEDCK